jgi:hypothetical protein
MDGLMLKTKTDFPCAEYAPAPFPTGATALISLGFVVLAIGIATSFTPTSRSVAHHGVHRFSPREKTPEEVRREFQADQLQYRLSEEAMYPSLRAIVFTRGPSFAFYHWRADCPMLHGLRNPITPKNSSHMTRQDAETLGYRPCHYCCEMQRRQRTGR